MKVEEAIDEALRSAFCRSLEDNDREEHRAIFLASLRANGWEVVPREATDAMLRKMCELNCCREECEALGECASEGRWKMFADHWRFALAAAQGDKP